MGSGIDEVGLLIDFRARVSVGLPSSDAAGSALQRKHSPTNFGASAWEGKISSSSTPYSSGENLPVWVAAGLPQSVTQIEDGCNSRCEEGWPDGFGFGGLVDSWVR